MNFKFISTALMSLMVACTTYAADVKTTPTEAGLQVKLADKTFLVSKARFSSEEEAVKFCTSQKQTLSKKGLELLKQAVAATTDSQTLDAMTFKLAGEFGVWAWAADGTNAISVAFESGDKLTRKYHAITIGKIAEEAKTLEAGKVPAVCE